MTWPFVTAPDSVTSTAWRDSALVVVTLGVFATGNAAFVILTTQFYEYSMVYGRLIQCLSAAFSGAVIAEAGLHTIWTVFSNVRVFRRFLLSGIAAVILLLSIFGPQLLDSPLTAGDWPLIWPFFLILPVPMLGLQAPLWLLKSGAGWHVVGPGTPPAARLRKPLSISGLFLATAVVAVCLTCLRLVGIARDMSTIAIATQIIVPTALLCAASLLVLVPSLFATLRAKKAWMGLGVIMAIELLIALALFSLACFTLGSPPFEEFFYAGCIFLGFAASLYAPLMIARRLGYRLQTARGEQAANDNPFSSGDEPADKDPPSAPFLFDDAAH